MYERVAGLIVQRQLPTLVLVNRAEEPIDLAPLEALNAAHLSGARHRLAAFVTFNQAALQGFEWLVEQLG
jgi:hypothetical protein